MFYKNTLDNYIDKKVKIYWNLRKRCYSIQYKGKVIAHSPYVSLRDCKFVVQPSGHKRVMREKCKNVHAFICGTLIKRKSDKNTTSTISYNPYHGPYFYNINNNEPILLANEVVADTMGAPLEKDMPYVRI